MADSIKIKGILLMAGSGLRFGGGLPKQFHRLSGKKIYLHTLDKFVSAGRFDEIILACPQQWIEEVREDLKAFPARVKIIAGGAIRQESSYLALLACGGDTDYVVIHDAVRPFVTERIILDNIEAAIHYGAADTCIPSADTIVHSKSGSSIAEIPNRSEYLRGQTPQSFKYDLILEAHKKAQASQLQASDDCRLAIEMGKEVHIVQGDEHNIKITTELDLYLAEQLFRLPASSPAAKGSLSLQGKRVAITGGTGGIGSAVADRLLKEGAIPILISRGAPEYPADLTSFEAASAIFKQCGPVDALVNSLGLFKLKDLNALSSEEIEQLLAVNLKGLIFSCKAAHIRPGGHIINIASSAYSRGRKDYTVYSCAKAAVVNFTQGLSEERPDLRINAVVPQRTSTSMRHSHFPNENRDALLSPEKVAEAIVDLLKQSVTGSIVEVRKN